MNPLKRCLFVLTLFCFMLSACAAQQRQVRRDGVLMPVEQAADLEFQDLQKKYVSDPDSVENIAALKRFISAYEETAAEDRARFVLSQALYRKNLLSESYEIARHIDTQSFSESDASKLFHFLALNASKNEYFADAVQWNVELIKTVSSESMRHEIWQQNQRWIITKLTKQDVQNLLERYAQSYPAGLLHFQYGKMLLQEGDKGSAKGAFERALTFTSDTREKEHIQAYISQTGTEYTTQKNVVGAILPLSGKYASFGERSLRGIQMGFSFFNGEGEVNYELAIYDSQGNADVAAQGVHDLLERRGVVAIIGPLLSGSSEEAARRAQQLDVPMVNLSQHKTITEIGDAIFRLAMTKKNQVDVLTKFACEEKGFKKFAILYPEDAYGIEFANLFWTNIDACGGEIIGIESYASNQNSFNMEIKKLVGLHQMKARKEEYRMFEEQAKIELDRDEVTESQVKMPPQIDFDVLFVPDYAKTIGQVAPTLAYYDIENVMLLGTEGWHSEKLIERGQEHVEGAVFVDGFFDKSEDDQVRAFVHEFEKAFEESPHVWEAQAFDATRFVLAALEQNEIENREDLKERLSEIRELSGVTGTIRFTDNRDVEKDLFLLTVRRGKIQAYTPSE